MSQAWTQGSLAQKIKRRKAVPEVTTSDLEWTVPFEIPGDNYDAKRSWVYGKLSEFGCLKEYASIKDLIKRMRIFPPLRGQQTVLIECTKIGQNDEIAGVLYGKSIRDGVSLVQSRSRSKIPVYMSWVRASIDVQKYIIEDFLSQYGEVIEHKPTVDKEGVETFVHVFWMWEKDLVANPPPSFYWMGKERLRVRYRNQVPTCWNCDAPGHMSRDCTNKSSSAQPQVCWSCNQPGHLAKDCTVRPHANTTNDAETTQTLNGQGSEGSANGKVHEPKQGDTMVCELCKQGGHNAKDCVHCPEEPNEDGQESASAKELLPKPSVPESSTEVETAATPETAQTEQTIITPASAMSLLTISPARY